MQALPPAWTQLPSLIHLTTHHIGVPIQQSSPFQMPTTMMAFLYSSIMSFSFSFLVFFLNENIALLSVSFCAVTRGFLTTTTEVNGIIVNVAKSGYTCVCSFVLSCFIYRPPFSQLEGGRSRWLTVLKKPNNSTNYTSNN